MGTHNLTVPQQVWLAAYTAAIQSPAKYNPVVEADECLAKFNEKFVPSAQKQMLTEDKNSLKFIQLKERLAETMKQESERDLAPDSER
jgi:hypothetical protein